MTFEEMYKDVKQTLLQTDAKVGTRRVMQWICFLLVVAFAWSLFKSLVTDVAGELYARIERVKQLSPADAERGRQRQTEVCAARCKDSGGAYSVECLSGEAGYVSRDCQWYCTCHDGFQSRVY